MGRHNWVTYLFCYGGEIGTGTAVFTGRHTGLGFENVGKIVLIRKPQMVGNGLDGMGCVLQEHFREGDFSVNEPSAFVWFCSANFIKMLNRCLLAAL